MSGEMPSERVGIFLNPNNNRWLSLLKKSLQKADDMRQKIRTDENATKPFLNSISI